jgi:SAM-dependent methyltransferase
MAELEMPGFDFDETFGENYLYFHEHLMDAEASDREASEIIEMLGLEPGERVLDVPCGHGRIANRLASLGITVVGVDASSSFLDLARAEAAQRGVSTTFLRGDMRALEIDGGFDAVVCWNNSFGYFSDDDNLTPGGRLLIETMQHDSFVRHFSLAPDAEVMERGDDVLIDRHNFDLVTGRVETDRLVTRDGRTTRSHHFVRLPTVPEWEWWLADAGFGEVQLSGPAGTSLSLDSWTQVVRARA